MNYKCETSERERRNPYRRKSGKIHPLFSANGGFKITTLPSDLKAVGATEAEKGTNQTVA